MNPEDMAILKRARADAARVHRYIGAHHREIRRAYESFRAMTPHLERIAADYARMNAGRPRNERT